MLYCNFVKQLGGGNCKWVLNCKDVVELFEKNGLKNCKSIITSGNFIFESRRKPLKLDKIIKDLLQNHYQQKIDVFTKSKNEIIDIYNNFPYQIESGFYYNVFLTNVVDYENVIFQQFTELSQDEELIIKNNVCYWKIKKIIGMMMETLFYKQIRKNNFKNNYTLRTIGTIEKVYKKLLVD